jgi:predicted enzyme related to lactoylglutathione lyase
MTQAFVWFHNSSARPAEATEFYRSLFGWVTSDGPGGMTMLAGGSGPFAGVAKKDGDTAGWIPYAQVNDVDLAAERALSLGAVVIKAKTRGPAGDFVVIQDPGGATLALWQKVG